MTSIEAVKAALRTHWPDERGVCRCDRCDALRELLAQLEASAPIIIKAETKP